jgi:hypothetical protein
VVRLALNLHFVFEHTKEDAIKILIEFWAKPKKPNCHCLLIDVEDYLS